jgi:hypothetical protein
MRSLVFTLTRIPEIRLVGCALLAIALLSATAYAQMLTTMNVTTADRSSVLLQLTRSSVSTPNADPVNCYLKIEGVDGEQASGSVVVFAIPLDLVGSSLANLTAGALLGGIAVVSNTTTVQNAEDLVAQIAHVRLVFTNIQLPTTFTPGNIGALTTIAASLVAMIGGPPPPEMEGAPVAQLIQALGLPSPCPPTTLTSVRPPHSEGGPEKQTPVPLIAPAAIINTAAGDLAKHTAAKGPSNLLFPTYVLAGRASSSGGDTALKNAGQRSVHSAGGLNVRDKDNW